MPIENDNVSQSANSATVRRRVGAVHIPQAAGWRQVMGLSHQSEQPTTPQTASHHQDSLFRRVASLANPTNAPLGSPGDIARRSPVSGSLISIASSMRSAIHTQSGSSTPISSLNTDRTKVARKLGRKSASRSQKDAPTISEAKPPRNQVARSEQKVFCRSSINNYAKSAARTKTRCFCNFACTKALLRSVVVIGQSVSSSSIKFDCTTIFTTSTSTGSFTQQQTRHHSSAAVRLG